MPTYQVKCKKCGTRAEIKASFAEFDRWHQEGKPMPLCNCGSKPVLVPAPFTFII